MHTLRDSLFQRVAAISGAAAFAVAGLAAQSTEPGSAQPASAGQSSAKPSAPSAQPSPGGKPPTPAAPAAVTPPADYVIGADDVLIVTVYKTPEVSGEVGVRPDGKISIPMINDVTAAGKTPEELRTTLTTLFKSYFTDPLVTVIVKQINSRKVSITGSVPKPGPYALMGPMTVLQLISQAGGLSDFAKAKEIVIIRPGVPTPFKVNYDELKKGKNLKQNIELRPGDQIIVP
jgi:polysaccharide export outer membrane protein